MHRPSRHREPAARCPGRPAGARVGGLALLVLGLSAAHATALDAQERAGRMLYREGITAAGTPVQARIGVAGAPVSGAAAACINCHGADGLGRAEGGVAPSAITWAELSKPYGHDHASGRRHPAFTEQDLARALARGVDPAGHRLDPAMPRFLLAREDLANLSAYLKRIDRDLDPGIAEDRIRVGTLLPLQGPLAAAGQAVQRMLQAGFDEINRAGGLHGRRLELVVAEHGADSAATLAHAERLLGQDVLALLSPMSPGDDSGLAALAEARQVPVIGPFTLQPQQDGAAAPHTFHLFGGPLDQARVLAAFYAERLKSQHPGALLLLPSGPGAAGLARAIAEECESLGCGPLERVEYPPGGFEAEKVVRQLRRGSGDALFFLGSDEELAALLREAARTAWHPRLLLPGPSGARTAATAPAGFDGRIFLAYPNLPSAPSDAAARGFAELQRRHGLGDGHLGVQISAYAGTLLLAEALRRSGRALSRERLLASLESVHGLPTGVTPPLSYGPQRRTGSRGGFVVALDARHRTFRPVSAWIGLE